MASLFGEKNILNIPENILLEIFSYLPLKDLCTAGRVCKAWRRIVRDNTLWKHVDLRSYKLDLNKMWKVIRSRLSEVLISLRLRGYMDPALKNWSKKSLSDAMLSDIQQRCPNLRTLELIWTNLTNVSAKQLPGSLQEILLTDSFVTAGWFEPLQDEKILPLLTYLDLTNNTKVTSTDLSHISCKKELKVLKLNGDYRITDDGIKTVANNLKKLTTLEISNTAVTDLGLHYVGRQLANLERLDLSKCLKVTDGGIYSIASGLKKLQWISVESCLKLTEDSITHLGLVTKITYINFKHIPVTKEGVDKIKHALPRCQILGP